MTRFVCLMIILCVASPLCALAVEVSEGTGSIDKWQDCLGVGKAWECDDVHACVWCEGKVGTGCYPMAAAKLLPHKLYKCDKNVDAVRTTVTEECSSTSEGMCIVPCVWCTSAAVGDSCFTEKQARLLPSAIFECKFAPSVEVDA